LPSWRVSASGRSNGPNAGKIRVRSPSRRHVIQYVLIIGFLAVVNAFTYRGSVWVVWAAIPWALALALHGLRVFDRIPFLNGDWERRAVEKYLGRKL
jgi:hypothetical protein